ncbi:hypothetical protein DPEC_G00309570 [Dallia pectoralis]|uniref:Uncharacterized protein n=1 Tax=Dallia pectoralis TaxID=75939 RepID=A0ACC2FF54_DALPE|nr:hypothetical protein DPEC_G00309570 [Dallia pectoralis]
MTSWLPWIIGSSLLVFQVRCSTLCFYETYFNENVTGLPDDYLFRVNTTNENDGFKESLLRFYKHNCNQTYCKAKYYPMCCLIFDCVSKSVPLSLPTVQKNPRPSIISKTDTSSECIKRMTPSGSLPHTVIHCSLENTSLVPGINMMCWIKEFTDEKSSYNTSSTSPPTTTQLTSSNGSHSAQEIITETSSYNTSSSSPTTNKTRSAQEEREITLWNLLFCSLAANFILLISVVYLWRQLRRHRMRQRSLKVELRPADAEDVTLGSHSQTVLPHSAGLTELNDI